MFESLSHKLPVMLALAGAACSTQAQVYSLVWADEFNGASLDLSNWEPQIGTGTSEGLPAGWGNNELQYYTNRPENITVDDGKLTITARREFFGGRQYTSARLRTKERASFEFGRFEGRIKVPGARGMWPAYWMLPEDRRYGGWAASGEIDIMETANEAVSAAGTIHFGGEWPTNTSRGGSLSAAGAGISSFADDFHVYAIEWTPTGIRWFIDGQFYHQESQFGWFSSNAPGDLNAPFDQPMHLLLNLAIGGNYPGVSPNSSTPFPQQMEVDWVRVYQLVDQAAFNGSVPVITDGFEAEDFDEGGQGVSYNDCDTANQGGAYRDEGVDIEASTVFGFNVAYLCEDEWLEYTVDVPTAGRYRMSALVASQSTGGSFRMEVEDGIDSPIISFPQTNGWQNWETVTGDLALNAGRQTIRFQNTAAAGQEYNLNRFSFTLLPLDCNATNLIPGDAVDAFDVIEYVRLYTAGDPAADVAAGFGEVNEADLAAFLSATTSCP